MPPKLLRLKNKKSGLELQKNIFLVEHISTSAIKSLQFKPLHLFIPENNDVPYSFAFGRVIFVSAEATLYFLIFFFITASLKLTVTLSS